MLSVDCRSKKDLCEVVLGGEEVAFVFFWAPHPAVEGEVDSACLSQWSPHSFVLEGVEYATAEHYMMAGKARLFGDDEKLAEILACASPAEARKLGRQVRGFQEESWKAHRVEIVVQGNVGKFGQDEALRDFLMGTRQRVLVEASPRDGVWGIGLGKDNPRAQNPETWRGINLLGFALMEARARLSPKV